MRTEHRLCGVLKDWLVRALTGAFARNANVLTPKDLRAYALSVAQCDKMLAEALEGEVRLLESTEQRSRLRTRLGLNPQEGNGEDATIGKASPTAVEVVPRPKSPRKPGQRRPGRDPIGRPAASYATAATI